MCPKSCRTLLITTTIQLLPLLMRMQTIYATRRHNDTEVVLPCKNKINPSKYNYNFIVGLHTDKKCMNLVRSY